jgi:hypothetical protein
MEWGIVLTLMVAPFTVIAAAVAIWWCLKKQ